MAFALLSIPWFLWLKYTGTLLTLAYGVYATVNEFKENRHGKKVLTKRGRFGLVGLALSGLMSLSGDMYKDSDDARNSSEARKTLQDQQTPSRTRQISPKFRNGSGTRTFQQPGSTIAARRGPRTAPPSK